MGIPRAVLSIKNSRAGSMNWPLQCSRTVLGSRATKIKTWYLPRMNTQASREKKTEVENNYKKMHYINQV
jgi:hypothetical protein